MTINAVLLSSELKALSRLQPLRSFVRIAAEFSLIGMLAYIQASGYLSLWYLPISFLIIGSRQHALLVLLHEAAHNRLSHSRHGNEILGSIIGWNFLMSFHGYRRHHVFHHDIQKLNTQEDPDWARKKSAQWEFPMNPRRFFYILLRDVFLLNTWDYIQEAKDANNNAIHNRKDLYLQLGRFVYLALLIGALVTAGIFKIWLLYWILPIFTTLKAILRVRSVADHFCTNSDHPLSKSRTILGQWWDRLLLAPCSVSIHGVHHLYPSIPYYRLKEAHQLMSTKAVYHQHAHVCSHYGIALGECFAQRGTR